MEATMGEVLAMGMTHYPALLNPDEYMASVLRWTLKDPALPEAYRSPQQWPKAMRDEYGDDEGRAGATEHRRRCVADFDRLRAELDAFRPVCVVIFGDDQYENFRE